MDRDGVKVAIWGFGMGKSGPYVHVTYVSICRLGSPRYRMRKAKGEGQRSWNYGTETKEAGWVVRGWRRCLIFRWPLWHIIL